MTETQPPNETHGDLLLTFVVAFLAPMFLTASGGDLTFARLAAIQTIEAYRARSQADLITIAQIIACGLAALGSLGLSMADDLSVSMVLRLRANAVALNRAADQNRRTLAATRTAEPITPPDPIDEAAIQANIAAARKLTAEAMANLQKPEPPPVAEPPHSQREWQIRLASAMSDVAAEFTADIANLPPQQQAIASRRATLLSGAATDVILGNIPPPPKPGDLAALMQSGK
jgi:hypothetical protein